MFGVSSQSATFLTERVVGRWEGLRGELASDVDPAEEGLFGRESGGQGMGEILQQRMGGNRWRQQSAADDKI